MPSLRRRDHWSQRTEYDHLSAIRRDANDESTTNGSTEKGISTELSHEIGTTDVSAEDDITAEVMITTPGKIPNEMYDLEDTTPFRSYKLLDKSGGSTEEPQSASHIPQIAQTNRDIDTEWHGTTEGVTDPPKLNDSSCSNHSAVFIILAIALLVLLLLCCVVAFIIARTRKRGCKIFGKPGETDCDQDCAGASQPLLSPEKVSDTTVRTSIGSKN